jgi:hypothetical protein
VKTKTPRIGVIATADLLSLVRAINSVATTHDPGPDTARELERDCDALHAELDRRAIRGRQEWSQSA